LGPTSRGRGLLGGARLAGAVLCIFDPAPGRALVRACTGHTKSIYTRGGPCAPLFISNRPRASRASLLCSFVRSGHAARSAHGDGCGPQRVNLWGPRPPRANCPQNHGALIYEGLTKARSGHASSMQQTREIVAPTGLVTSQKSTGLGIRLVTDTTSLTPSALS
jgi:hypothetical protein